MPTLSNRSLPRPRGFVIFILLFTLAVMGINPAGKASIVLACVSLLFQIPLFLSATKHVNHNQNLVLSLYSLYATNALGQLFIVRMFAPYLLAWIFVNFYLAFPKLVNLFLDKLYDLADKAFSFTEVLERNAMQILFSVIANVINNPDVVVDVGKSFYWILAGGIFGGITGDDKRGNAFEAVKWSAGNALSSLLGEILSKTPLFLIIPTEIFKYRVLMTAVKSYQHLNVVRVRSCQDVLVMSMVLSLPIANVQVVSSAGLVAHIFSNDDGGEIFTCFMAIIAVYALGMISCGMLGVVVAENSVLGREYGTWSARILSVLLIGVADVMMGLSAFCGILTSNVRAMVWSTMLVMVLGSGLFLWRRVMQMIDDELGINMTGRSE